MTIGYYRHPSICSDTIAFVCEDDIWTVPAQGGTASRLTANLGAITYPAFDRDGKYLSYLCREEGGEEIYLMPSSGGMARRLTFVGGRLSRNAGWTPDGKMVFSCNFGLPILKWQQLFTVDIEGSAPQPLNVGPARSVSFGPHGGMVIGRNTDEPRHWKRDRGGTVGNLWVDQEGNGSFCPLINLNGDMSSPMWIGDRIYFLSDHEGIGNLYSCLSAGGDLRRHTHHENYYAYNASSDGHRIVYHSGAELFMFDPSQERGWRIPVEIPSSRTQRNRKFVNTGKYLQHWTLHPDGQEVAIVSRGKLFSFPNWEGPVISHNPSEGVRYRLAQFLNDGKRLIALTDIEGEERFAIFELDEKKPYELFPFMDIGRPELLSINPRKDQVGFLNQRNEIFVLDLGSRELILVDRGLQKSSRADRFSEARHAYLSWSPDGEWLAYSLAISLHHSQLKIWNAAAREAYPITEPLLRDEAPSFDPSGKYLFFISYRSYNPFPDNLHFEASFPKGMKPYLITLRKDLPSPFNFSNQASEPEQRTSVDDTPIKIDLEGIKDRVIAFPVEDGQYGRIFGMQDSKVLYSRYPIEGLFNADWEEMPLPKGQLVMYDLVTHEEKNLISQIDDFNVSRDGKTFIYRLGEHVRVLSFGKEPLAEAGDTPGQKSGWLDLDRVKVSIQPEKEWPQMFQETWRLQRDYYWTADMSGVDWPSIYKRYQPLVERVGCRSEMSALIWEMQTELGIGHCYEDGGDYRAAPNYELGFLGADFIYDPAFKGWQITHIVRGDSWDEKYNSPLNMPGINIKEGDYLIAINGSRLNRNFSPAAALVNLGGNWVSLTIVKPEYSQPQTVTVKALRDEMPARYREWVNRNREYVHAATEGRVGYLHIPDMEVRGYAEFHRGYLQEIEREALIVDVRYNTGGYVSPLILEKLRRKRTGYTTGRWGTPDGYPPDTLIGPMVALCNEFTGSDGDLFSHNFKLMKCGLLIGKRTWGGVVGIWPRNPLVDGTITTQPEFAYWMSDVGWGLENHGTEPDIEVENLPQDYARGVDSQLERAIKEILRLLEVASPRLPDFSNRPDRSLPRLSEKN